MLNRIIKDWLKLIKSNSKNQRPAIANLLKPIHMRMIHCLFHDCILLALKGQICNFSLWFFNNNSFLSFFCINFTCFHTFDFFIVDLLFFLNNFSLHTIFCPISIIHTFIFFSIVFMMLHFFNLLIVWFV